MNYLNTILIMIVILICYNSQNSLEKIGREIQSTKESIIDERNSNDKLKSQFIEYVKKQAYREMDKKPEDIKEKKNTVGEPEKNLVKKRLKDCYYYTGAGEKIEYDCITGRPLAEDDE